MRAASIDGIGWLGSAGATHWQAAYPKSSFVLDAGRSLGGSLEEAGMPALVGDEIHKVE